MRRLVLALFLSLLVPLGAGAQSIWPGGSATKLQGRPISRAAPSTSDVLIWTGTNWAPGVGGGGGGNATELQGRPIVTNTPSTSNVLTWTGTDWAPGEDSSLWRRDKVSGFTVVGPVTNEGAITALRLVVRDTNGNVWCQITPTNFVFGTNTFRLDAQGNIEASNSDALLYSVEAGLFSGYFAGDGFSLTNMTISSLNFTNLPSGGKCLMVDAMGDLYFGDASVADLHSNAVQKTGSAITGPLRVVADTWVAQSFDVAPPSTVSLGTGASWSAESGISISMFGTQCTVSNANAVGAGVLYVSGEVWRVTSGSGGGFSFSFCPRSDATALFSDMTYSPATGSSTNFEATFSSTGKCNVVAFSTGGSGSPATWSISNLTVRWTPVPLVDSTGASMLKPTLLDAMNNGRYVTGLVVIGGFGTEGYNGPGFHIGWRHGGGYSLSSYSILISQYGSADNNGVAIGAEVFADGGLAIGSRNGGGARTYGHNYGAAFGGANDSRDFGSGLGFWVNAYNYGAGVGCSVNAIDYGSALGSYTFGSFGGLAAGVGARGAYTNVALGYGAWAGDSAAQVNRVAIGPLVSNAVDNSTRVMGDIWMDGRGGTGNSIVFSNGVSKLVCSGQTNLYWCTVGFTGLVQMIAADLP